MRREDVGLDARQALEPVPVDLQEPHPATVQHRRVGGRDAFQAERLPEERERVEVPAPVLVLAAGPQGPGVQRDRTPAAGHDRMTDRVAFAQEARRDPDPVVRVDAPRPGVRRPEARVRLEHAALVVDELDLDAVGARDVRILRLQSEALEPLRQPVPVALQRAEVAEVDDAQSARCDLVLEPGPEPLLFGRVRTEPGQHRAGPIEQLGRRRAALDVVMAHQPAKIVDRVLEDLVNRVLEVDVGILARHQRHDVPRDLLRGGRAREQEQRDEGRTGPGAHALLSTGKRGPLERVALRIEPLRVG